MAILSNVAIIGASGNIGVPVLTALLADASLSVTILARPTSSIHKSPPSGGKLIAVDFSDHSALVSALQGIDAVVSTVGAPGVAAQKQVIDAAVEAGVKRFIPSEFGSDLDNPKSAGLAVFAGKVVVRKQLEQLAAQGRITWSAITPGAFLDWGIKVGFIGPNPKTKTSTLFDGGERPFAASLLSDIAQSVVGILHHPEETKNKLLYIYSAQLTLKHLTETYEKLLGVPIETTVVSTEQIEKEANEKIANGDPSGYVQLIPRAIFGEGYGGSNVGRDSNALLGIKPLDQAGLEEVIKKYL
ncbi:putative isoflavone reductase like protein P3 [Tricharina praecox]|uniref:putative isoflavone reductase like protein P3 n=1 Tax=Tricharina praecox TaxID=43433 RepID=UPI00221F97B4|nr:putative isoflavone reductase like protein P3 [Tricharina praecox]KAI5849194.1 putative isoflavone reductase like protein P3 [Tricharina praecox]